MWCRHVSSLRPSTVIELALANIPGFFGIGGGPTFSRPEVLAALQSPPKEVAEPVT